MKNFAENIIARAKQIKCLICDLDGVLTNGGLYLDNLGNELKVFNVQDGMGLKLLMLAGIEVAVITTSDNKVVENRMKQLGIRHYFTGHFDKRQAFTDLKQSLNLSPQEIAYIGDDLPDLPMICEVGLGVAVANAVYQVKDAARLVTEKSGGDGAVRELCDLILSTQELFEKALTRYYSHETSNSRV